MRLSVTDWSCAVIRLELLPIVTLAWVGDCRVLLLLSSSPRAELQPFIRMQVGDGTRVVAIWAFAAARRHERGVDRDVEGYIILCPPPTVLTR